MINWLHNNYGGFKAESILINCHYPVSQDSFVLQWGVIVEKPKGLDEKTTDKLAQVFTEGVSKGFLQDVEIWKHKTRIDNPLLVEEDGAVYQMRRWYQQFYVDVADVAADMTDRFEIEVDTTAANEKWHVEVEENLRRKAEAGRGEGSRGAAGTDMTTHDERTQTPDVDRLARSMLQLHGAHDDDDHPTGERRSERILVARHRISRRPATGRRRARGDRTRPGALSQRGADAGRLPVLPRHRRREEARSRDTPRCSGAPRRRSDARRSPRCAPTAATAAAAGRARGCPTASSTPSPKAASTRSPPRRLPGDG